MADPAKKYWIVLVNKTPQGPYSENDLKALLDSHQLSRNEVGMQVSADGKDRLSGWKILWQFEEFDRRRKKVEEVASEPVPPVERRKALTEPDLQKVTSEKVPDHLMEIAPEELVPHRENRSSNASNDFSQEDYSSLGRADESGNDFSWWPTAAAGIGAMALVVLGAQWISGWMSEKPAVTSESAPRVERRLTNQIRSNRARRERGNTPLSGVKAPPESLPERPSPEPMEPPPVEEVRDFGQVPESVFDEMGEAESLRRRIQRKGRNLRRRQGIQPLAPGDDLGQEEGEYYEDEGYADEENPVEEEQYFDEEPSDYEEGY